MAIFSITSAAVFIAPPAQLVYVGQQPAGSGSGVRGVFFIAAETMCGTLSLVPQSIRQWWRAGEDGAIRVYRPRRLVPLFLAISTCTVLCAVYHFFRFWELALITYALCIVIYIVTMRRAILLMPSSIGYRPVFDEPKFARYESISRAEESWVGWGGGYPVKGIRIHMADGSFLDIPLIIGPRSVVLQGLENALAGHGISLTRAAEK
ncbi:MAG: hypothetical protein KGM47_13220 [Acidobacteriota bacterium]|nr:hypothetical protein [Acidobacteriota bacterium]